jgi:murein DD-endopeptidase MepM/ murein hydrolase activator NlpD
VKKITAYPLILIGATVLIAVQPVIVSAEYSEEQGIEYGAPHYDPNSPDCLNTGSPTPPGNELVTGTAQSFTDAYIQHAYDVSQKSGVPWEIIMGQASLESGWGQSTLSSQYFNFFGIKAKDSDPPDQKTPPLPTIECDPRGCAPATAVFRKYTSPTDSFNDHARLMLTERYLPALQFQHDPRQYVTAIWKAGYATDLNYANKVMSRVDAVITALGSRYGTTYKPSSELTFPANPTTPQGSPSGSTPNECPTSPGGGILVGDFAWIIDKKWYDDPATYYGVMKGHQANSGFYYKYGDGNRYAIDISPPGIYGAPQYALLGGTVTRVRLPSSNPETNGGLEIKSVLPDGRILMHLYAHSEKVTVGVGDTVKAGQQVAVVGNMGNSAVPHIHWEIMYKISEQDKRPICGNDIFIELANNRPINLEALAAKASPNCLGRAKSTSTIRKVAL